MYIGQIPMNRRDWGDVYRTNPGGIRQNFVLKSFPWYLATPGKIDDGFQYAMIRKVLVQQILVECEEMKFRKDSHVG